MRAGGNLEGLLGPGGNHAEHLNVDRFDSYVNYLTGPETQGLEVLSKDEAIRDLKELEHKGLCHTLWTFITPFIGGICNCDRSGCLGIRTTVNYSFPTMFRAEYIAEVNPDLCKGCRACTLVCQFGAISYNVAQKKVVIDPLHCYGCGICRATCVNGAIVLKTRSAGRSTVVTY